MIKELTLIGFKSFLHRIISLNRLTVLTGLNSSGKSTVIQALLMLEKAHKGENSILLDGYGSIDEVRNLYFQEEVVLSVLNEAGKAFLAKIPINKQGYSVCYRDDFDFPEILYISANRFGPKTSIQIYNDTYKRTSIGPNGENLFQCIKVLADEPLNGILRHESAEGETLIFNIRGWLSMIAPNVKFDYNVNEISDSSYSTFNDHRSANVGFGLSYALPVITALLVGTLLPNRLVIIENPEAHLHPRGQTELARLISLSVQAGAQVIIETHSDHIFDGIRISTKAAKGFAKDVQVHWFELDGKGLTEVYSPELSDDGRLNEWPKGFFDQFEINASKLL